MTRQEQFPKCNVGDAVWNDHGGQYSPMGCSRWVKCAGCGAMALEVSREGGALFLIDPSQADIDYINRGLDIVWRDRATKVKKYRDDRWFSFVSETLGRTITTDAQLDDWPLDERRATYARLEEATGANPDTVVPPDMEQAAQPIGCPDSWATRAFVWQRPTMAWEPVDMDATRAPMPQDPRRVATLAYFAAVWNRVREATGIDVTPVVEIPNGYYDDVNQSEPWFSFAREGRTYRIGWRKRVVNIDVAGSDTSTTDARAICRIAKADQTTHTVEGEWSPSNPSERAKEVTVHAWSQDKVVEYLSVLLAS